MKINKVIIPLAELLLFFTVWQGAVLITRAPDYLFPSPLKVFSILISNSRLILSNALLTFGEAFTGFILANFISVLIAFFIAFNGKIENIVMPVAIAIKTIPVIALTPLLILWFGSGSSSKIITAMLICFFPALVNVLRGIKSLEANLLALFKVYEASKTQLIKMLIFPSILPYLFSALKVSSSLAVVGALVGEFIGANRGLGFLIISGYYNMNTAFVFAAISVSSIMGISFYYLIHFFEKKLVLKSELIS